ncbi:hypothetical protein PQX77_002850 [Marasmius sp. AFHP31]|nr:hypothetical protein PQX77_002850 [Marasmius sp. AFHP31]
MDLDDMYEPVLESLGLLPHLVDVQILTDIDPSMLPLHFLKNGTLRRLAIQQKDQVLSGLSDVKQFMSSLSTVFVQNPLLIHLELDTTFYRQASPPFQDLFRNVRHHLQSLSSTELPQSWSSDFDSLWKLLDGPSSNTRVPLHRISRSKISEELLDLLQSPSTQDLEILEFRPAEADTDEQSDRFAQSFYNDILRRHQNTLRELALIPSCTEKWMIGFRNLDVFDECK